VTGAAQAVWIAAVPIAAIAALVVLRLPNLELRKE
jgi:hypothetical protein